MARLEEYGKFDVVAKEHVKEERENYIKARKEIQRLYKPKFDELFPNGLVSDKIKDPRRNPLLNPDSPHHDEKTKKMIAQQREQQEMFGDLLGDIDKKKDKASGAKAKEKSEDTEKEEVDEKKSKNPDYQPDMEVGEVRSLVKGQDGAVVKTLLRAGKGYQTPGHGAICQVYIKTTKVSDGSVVFETDKINGKYTYYRVEDTCRYDSEDKKKDWSCGLVEDILYPKILTTAAKSLGICLETMKQGEKCTVVYTTPYGEEDGEKLKSEIELLSWMAESRIGETDAAIKRTIREGGNDSGLGWAFGKDETLFSVKLIEGAADGKEKDLGEFVWGIQTPTEGYDVPPGVLEGVRQMKIHELSQMFFQSDCESELISQSYREQHGLSGDRLIYEVHLHHINKVRELLRGDAEMKTVKENKKEGYNYPVDFQKVKIRLVARREGDPSDSEPLFTMGKPAKYERGYYQDGLVTVRINNGDVPRAINAALMVLRRREKAIVVAKPAAVFDTPEGKLVAKSTGISDEVFDSLVGENASNIVFEVELEEIEPRVKPWDMPVDYRIEYMETIKDAGNRFFKVGAIELAQQKYETASKVITNVSYYAIDDEEERKKTIPIRVTLFLNTASCLTKRGMYKEALEKIEEAAKWDEKNAKVHMRKAAIHLARDKFAECKEELARAKAIDPAVAGLRTMLKTLSKKVEASKKKVKNTYSGFLKKDGGFIADERSEAKPEKDKSKKNNWSQGTNDWLKKAKEFYGLQDFNTEDLMPDELKKPKEPASEEVNEES